MDREKKTSLSGVVVKANAVLSGIIENFKPSEGKVGAKRTLSRFTNLWSSGISGRVVLIGCPIVAFLLLLAMFSGSSSSAANSKTNIASQSNKALVVKGLSLGMSGDDAVKACKKIVGDSKDLVVFDFRNGYSCEKDEATITKEKKAYEKAIISIKWQEHLAKRREMQRAGKSSYEIDEMGLKAYSYDQFVAKNPDLDPYELLKDPSVKEELDKKKVTPPSTTYTLPKKNCISIRRREDKFAVDRWLELSVVWTDNSGIVKSIYFTNAGLNILFNARKVSGAEFADLLIKNFNGIPSFTVTAKTESQTRDESISLKTFTWLYKCADYQVQLGDCDFFDPNNQKISVRSDLSFSMTMQARTSVGKYLSIKSVDRASAPKFD